jgi:LDH2 family malate/lactate/ureidoglycolate dehydrogenase
MATSEIRVGWESLRDFTRDVFIRAGLQPCDAEIEAEVLLWANLRGVDSHGVLRIPGYVEFVDEGVMNPRPNIQVLKETSAALLIDADHAFGPVVTTWAMRQVMQKASEAGIGWGLIRNTTHQGAMGYYPLMAAREGMAGIALVCNPPNMAPYGAKSAGVHNSPIAICVPGKRHRPLLLDIATSVAAGGKLDLAIDRGDKIPVGWALDKQGNATTDPHLAAILLPFGGPKGSGLALMFECLASIMVGNPLLEPALQGKPGAKTHCQNSIVAAVNIGMFTSVEDYESHVDAVVDGIKALPPAEGFTEVLVPGEIEDRVHEERAKNGIPLPEGTVRKLQKIAERFNLQMPAGV